MDSHYEPHHFPGHVVFFVPSMVGQLGILFRFDITLIYGYGHAIWMMARKSENLTSGKSRLSQIYIYNIELYIYKIHIQKISTSISGELGHKLTAFYPSQVTRPNEPNALSVS
jgi:hypothetical protein